MQTYEWRPFRATSFDQLAEVRKQFHQAIQNVAAVGRWFSPKSKTDEYASLTWVPGFSRLAGQWVTGSTTFRSSISFEHFALFLVDERIQIISSLELMGKTHRQVMLWLEGQLGQLGLETSTMKLPYEIPTYPTQQGEPFMIEDLALADELARYYHNSFVCMREFKHSLPTEPPIKTWPHHFDQAMDVIIKDSGDVDTTSKISLGMSPGDAQFSAPYFYVNTWPHVDTAPLPKLSNGALWVEDSWTGAVLPARQMVSAADQKAVIMDFYNTSSELLIGQLTK